MDYDVVQLLTTLDLKGTRQHIGHGSMIVFIRHKTPYLLNTMSLLFLSFSLDNDVALCSVFGISSMLVMDTVVDLVESKLVCSKLSQNL